MEILSLSGVIMPKKDAPLGYPLPTLITAPPYDVLGRTLCKEITFPALLWFNITGKVISGSGDLYTACDVLVTFL
jgi:hypothetical protein